MRAELARVDAWGHRGELREWRPDDPERFAVDLRVVLSVPATGETRAFDVGLCSPAWFAERFAAAARHAPETGRLRGIALFRRLVAGPAPYDHEHPPERAAGAPVTGLLFAREWDHRRLVTTIRDLCERIEGRDGADLAAHVARLLAWEYDARAERAPAWTAGGHHLRLAA